MRHFCENSMLSGLWSNWPCPAGKVTMSSGRGWPKEREESASPKHLSTQLWKYPSGPQKIEGKDTQGQGQVGSQASMGWLWVNLHNTEVTTEMKVLNQNCGGVHFLWACTDIVRKYLLFQWCVKKQHRRYHRIAYKVSLFFYPLTTLHM